MKISHSCRPITLPQKLSWGSILVWLMNLLLFGSFFLYKFARNDLVKLGISGKVQFLPPPCCQAFTPAVLCEGSCHVFISCLLFEDFLVSLENLWRSERHRVHKFSFFFSIFKAGINKQLSLRTFFSISRCSIKNCGRWGNGIRAPQSWGQPRSDSPCCGALSMCIIHKLRNARAHWMSCACTHLVHQMCCGIRHPEIVARPARSCRLFTVESGMTHSSLTTL